MALDYGSIAAREFIKRKCRLARQGPDLISTHNTVNLVIRLTEKIAVKFGIGVVYAEASALQFAHEHLDLAIVRVPALIQFFTDETNGHWPTGYLVMELMSGALLDEIEGFDAASLTARLARIVNHLHTFTHTRPGPLGGGHARGLLWSEYSSGQGFETPEDLQAYLRIRLAAINGTGSIDVTKSRLCFCHLDISPRNILLDADGSMTLLDWGCAGFYPSIFETWSIQLEAHVRANPTWQLLASAIETRLSEHERSELSSLSRVYRANQAFML